MLAIAPGVVIPAEELVLAAVRASGPGGQHVNKVATAIELRFDVRRSRALSETVAVRLMRLAGRRLTKDGVIVIAADEHRSQERNREAAIARLRDLVREALKAPPPPRRPTRPTAGSVERRLRGKTVRASVKRLRRSPRDGD